MLYSFNDIIICLMFAFNINNPLELYNRTFILIEMYGIKNDSNSNKIIHKTSGIIC